MRTIVVGYDGTRSAERALERSAELAAGFGARVVVVDVAAPAPVVAMPGAFGLTPYYEAFEPPAQPEAALWQQHRERVQELFAAAGVPVEFAAVSGRPAAEIVEVAAQHEADLIVVGTREPGLVERLIGGSVSQGVARRARCDVLIVHPPPDEG